ncbi:uracil-DNA glycosylase [Longirhabdus pacifica]|uniref:uracil-DNA glycosylase n=1 Tax=Longirhabdus pacifica TaxID=2305227 RepID=UPI001008DBB9|nr:uracil-DNA glycosylase [Longirhabdus pacifica]
MNFHIGNDWDELLQAELNKPYIGALFETLQQQYAQYTVYPAQSEIFTALRLTSYVDTKVVIIGQDPYHGKGQAHGLSFSVKNDVRIPPSLRNIFKELAQDVGGEIPTHGSLEGWAEQGVLLLNTVLTVREASPNSHQNIGWELFTDYIIRLLNEREQPVVFILWGKHAEAKQHQITHTRHPMITSPHPSPFSAHRGFFGSKLFSKSNELLRQMNVEEIDWSKTSAIG